MHMYVHTHTFNTMGFFSLLLHECSLTFSFHLYVHNHQWCEKMAEVLCNLHQLMIFFLAACIQLKPVVNDNDIESCSTDQLISKVQGHAAIPESYGYFTYNDFIYRMIFFSFFYYVQGEQEPRLQPSLLSYGNL